MSPSVIIRVARTVLLLSLVLGMCVSGALGQADLYGQWSTSSYSMPINPVHTALLRNGKILVVAGSGNCPASQSGCPSGSPYGASNHSGALVLDPVAQSITQYSLSWDMFCNSMTVLADGRVFIDGGTLQYDPFLGSQKAAIFDPSTNAFTDVQSMAHGRWYPTVTLLGDGRVMAFAGSNETSGSTNSAVDLYTVGSGWASQTSSSWTPPLYPRMHLLPSGNVFVSAPNSTTYMFNPTTKAWSTVGNTKSGISRTYGSSVLLPLTPANNYDPRVMILGGGVPTATSTTEIIDLGASSPSWAYGPNMTQARVEMDAVLLPTGTVLALGGSSTDENASTASLNADLYDPDGNRFSSAGANTYARLYHTVALLLPDATVWLAGGNPQRGSYEQHVEIYQPAYLFTRDGNNNVVAATRPAISSVPGTINWNGQFTVTTPDAANISQAVLVRPGSSTHAFDMDQRLVELNFTVGSGTLTVSGPPNANIAPPGYYMLFLINTQGVPSVAKFLLLNGAANPAPNPASVSPSSGTTAGGTPVTITGTGFLAGAAVKFGGTSATGVSVSNSTTITATTPAHAAGAVNVVVTNTDNQSGTLNNGYTYTTSGGGGGIGFVQSNSGPSTIQASNTTVAVTYPVTQTAGDTNIVVVGWGDTSSTISSVTDNRLNSYALAVGPTSGTGLRQSIYYAPNIAGGSTTVTVTFNKAAAYPDVRILEYGGLDTSVPLDKSVGAAGTGTTANSGTVSTTTASELIFGAGTSGTKFTAAGSGFTSRMINLYGNIAEDKTVASTGSYNATATDASGVWVMQVATFRASGQGTSNPAPTVNGIGPSSGTTAGGTPVTITGTGFLAGATVKLGGTSATGVSVSNSTTITATTAAHAAGAVDVVVTNSDSQSGTLSQGYTYTTPVNPAPTVTCIAPSVGNDSGRDAGDDHGNGLPGGSEREFGRNSGDRSEREQQHDHHGDDAGACGGAVNVVVTNTDNQSGTLNNGYTYTTSAGGRRDWVCAVEFRAEHDPGNEHDSGGDLPAWRRRREIRTS